MLFKDIKVNIQRVKRMEKVIALVGEWGVGLGGRAGNGEES